MTRKVEVSNTSNYTVYGIGYNFSNTLKASSKNISDEKGHITFYINLKCVVLHNYLLIIFLYYLILFGID